MKQKKIIWIILICLIFITSFSVLITTGKPNQDATVEWHETITSGTTFIWKCDTFEVDPLNEPTIGGASFTLDSEIQIKVNQEPSLSYNDLFSNTLPFYFDYYLDDAPLDLSGMDIEVLRAFLWPLSVDWGNESTTQLYQFLEIYQPSSFNGTSVNPVDDSHAHFIWFDDVIENPEPFSINFAINLENGITDHIHFGDGPFNWGWTFMGTGQPESTSTAVTEGDESEFPTKITWSDTLTKGTVLAWNVTRFNQTSGDPLTFGDTAVKAGDILQLGLIKNPPTNPQEWMDPDGPPDWVQIFVNSKKIDLSNIGDEGELFLLMMVPLEYAFENGSVFKLKDFFDAFIGEDSDFSGYSRTTIDGIYYNVSWREEWTDNGESGWANHYVLTTIKTGVAIKRHVESSHGVMTWEFFERAANKDPVEGTTQAIDSSFEVSLEFPPPDIISGFELLPLLFACVLILTIKRKRR